MAARILWSTIPYQEQINHVPALYSLYHGAKEYLKYGAMAVMDELKYVKQLNTNTDKAFSTYQNNLTDFFKISAQLFYTSELWTAMYGGKLWGDISKRFSEMSIELELADKTRGKPDFIRHMNSVIMYMNVIDGMMHNSSNVLEKIIDQEFKENGQSWKDQISYQDKVTELMDVKELKNSDDVINYAANVVNDIPEKFLPFKDWILERKYKSNFEPKNQQDKEQELKLIRLKKLNQHDLQFMRENINKIKDFAFNEHEKWRYLADIMMSIKSIAERFVKLDINAMFNIDPIIKKIDDVLYRHSERLEDEQFCERFGSEIENVYYKLRDM